MSEQDWVSFCGGAIGTKVYKEVCHSRKCTLSDMVGSAGIEGLGRREASFLVGHGFDTLEKMLGLRVNDLLRLPGYQKTKAKKIVDGLTNFTDVLREVAKCVKIEKPLEATSSTLADRSVCFTGVRPSKDEEQAFASKGGKTASSVSKNITHLVQKDAASISSKSAKATALGVKVIGYKEWQAWL
jgi:NAD-dependent DNA ligase